MAHASLIRSRQQSHWFAASLTLAFWQCQVLWRLLALTLMGMIAAVLLTCTIPLFAWVTTSAGLQDTVGSSESSLVVVHSQASQVSTSLVKETHAQLDQIMDRHVRSYIQPDSRRFVFSLPALPLPATRALPASKGDTLSLWGYDMQQVASHVRVLEGHLPDPQAKELEVALTRKTAHQLQVGVGSTFTVPLDSLRPPLHVTALIEPLNGSDLFWYGTNLELQLVPNAGYAFTALLPREPLLAVLDTLRASSNSRQGLTVHPDYYWTYQINSAILDANQLPAFVAGLQGITGEVPVYVNSPGFFDQTTVRSPLDKVRLYGDHLSVAQIPVVVLSVLVIGLLLFFVSLMAELLVERQQAQFALLRSRGASTRQLFGVVFLQSLLLAVIALLVAPLLAIPVARLLAQQALAGQSYTASLHFLDGNPLLLLKGLWWLILGTIGTVALTMTFSAFRAMRGDVLSLRRSSGRDTRKPFWQRFYLDAVSVIFAVATYLTAVFVMSQGLIDAKTQVLIQGPLILIASCLLLLASTLLFLRLFPGLLTLGTRLAYRGQGLVSMLSFSLMARSPHQALRMILLLTFALAFTVFSLSFHASQSAHMVAAATYQAGADFSGEVLPQSTNTKMHTLQGQWDAYGRIPGVTHVASGFVSFGHVNDVAQGNPIKILAVDISRFAQAATWESRGALDTFNAHTARLTDQRAAIQQATTPTVQNPGTKTGDTTGMPDAIAIPALVDAYTWHMLQLQVGRTFTLGGVQGDVNFVAIGQISSLPGVNDRMSQDLGEPGILVDYTSFETMYNYNARSLNTSTLLAPNSIWLQSKDDTASLQSVRKALSQGGLRLGSLYDRRALQDAMSNDPLYINIIGVLLTGAVAPILLTLVGNLLTSWWHTQSRISNFVVLRALGTGPRQLLSILFFEQCIIYATAILLGILFGLVLTTLSLPALAFARQPLEQSGADASGAQIYASQNVPPIQLALPPTLLMVIMALAAICFLALFFMVRIVIRASINTTLRLNAD